LVWRNALKDQPSGVCVLALVALERDLGKAQPHGGDGKRTAATETAAAWRRTQGIIARTLC
jgi:hypothetical protein